MRKRIMKGLLGLCILLAAGVAGIYLTADTEGPEIVIPADDSLVYVKGADTDTLLQDVKAVDDREGDVSDTLMIESILPDVGKKQAAIIYAAKDSKNNVSKAVRMVGYQVTSDSADGSDSSGEEGGTDPLDVPAVSDIGDSSEGSDTPSLPPETQSAEAAIEAAIAALPAENPRLYLKEYEVALPVGSEFHKLSYVKEIIDDKDTKETLYQDIRIQGEVDVSTAGTYELIYQAVDSDGNRSNEAKLTVTVQ